MSGRHERFQIDEDPRFQQNEWRAQRIGTMLLAALVLAAALGFTGAGGVLNRTVAGGPHDSIRVEYERFVRRGARSTVVIHLRGSGAMQFWLSAAYFHDIDLESIVPEARLVSADRSRQVYVIRADAEEVDVAMEFEPRRFGRLDAEIGLVGGPSVRLRQLSWF